MYVPPNTQQKKPELLSPAGNMECFFAALENGADAVYFGLQEFSARASAQNFTLADASKAIAYARKKAVKVYIALNTLIKTNEIDRVTDLLLALEEMQPDALILQDLGLLFLLRSRFPQINLHASTQMTIHNLAGVKQLKQMGFRRVVLARELSIDEIGNIARNATTEIEVFVHGALCYSYSGLCLLSSMTGGRSGNRGRCAQPCRMRYTTSTDEGGYLFSMKDLLTIPRINDIMAAGVHSFKIEGRMKSPAYVAVVTDAYRQAIDGRLLEEDEAIRRVMTVFSRETTHAYLFYGMNDKTKRGEKHKLSHDRAGSNCPSPSYERGERGVVAKSSTDTNKTGQLSESNDIKAANAINSSYPANLGLYAGVVVKSEKGQIVIKADADIGVRDLLQVFEHDSAKPVLLHVKTITMDGKRVYSIKAGNVAALNTQQQFKRGAKLYLVSSQKVNESVTPKIPKKLVPAKMPVDITVSIRHDRMMIKGIIRQFSWSKDYSMKLESGINRITEEGHIRDCFSRLGETSFVLASIRADISEGLFIPLSILNDVRRDYFHNLSIAWQEERERRSREIKKWIRECVFQDTLAQHNRNQTISHMRTPMKGYEEEYKDAQGGNECSVDTFSEDAMRLSVKIDKLNYIQHIPLERIYKIYLAVSDEISFTKERDAMNTLSQIKDKMVFSLPVILRDRRDGLDTYEDIKIIVQKLIAQGFRQFQLCNLGAMGLFEGENVQWYADYPLYCLNPLSAAKLRELGFCRHTLSPEDDKENLQTLFSADADLIIYQDTPLFTSETCVWANMKRRCPGMKECGFKKVTVKNEYGDQFVAINERCKTLVISERPLSLFPGIPKLLEAGQRDFRIDLCWRDYTPEMIEDIFSGIQNRTRMKYSSLGNYNRGLR